MSGFLLYTDTVPTELQVTVKPIKADGNHGDVGGKPWDVGGALPDIAACFTVDGETSCVPEGKAPERVKKPLCPDALTCTVELEARRSSRVEVGSWTSTPWRTTRSVGAS